MAATRRELLGVFSAAALALPWARLPAAQRALLPLDTPGLDHLDVIVPDVEKTARFYMGLFRSTLHVQTLRDSVRYFVLLGPLPDNRAVGYIAIGASNGRGTYIGHFCTTVVDWRNQSAAIFAAMKPAFADAGLGEFPGATGIGGIFDDPDGIEIQFLPSPDTLVTAALPSDLVPGEQGFFVPRGVDSMLLYVSDLERALAYYRILYGREATRDAAGAEFHFRNGSRLRLEPTEYAYGRAQPRIARYGIRVDAFNADRAASAVTALGGTVVGNAGRALRIRDADGIELDLMPA